MSEINEHEERADCVYFARMAEQAERYEDMLTEMKKVAMRYGNEGLQMEERNLLSVAYKNVVGPMRTAWRVICSLEQREKNNIKKIKRIREYKLQIESELDETCNGILSLLNEYLIPSDANDDESKVFYLKLKGDYYRYLSEFKMDQERKDAAENTLLAYKEAQDIANNNLKSSHPIRLGLALNFSVFYYEILNSKEHSCKIAQQALFEACNDINEVKEGVYNDSTLIMQLLRDNLTLWTSTSTEDWVNQVSNGAGNIHQNNNNNNQQQQLLPSHGIGEKENMEQEMIENNDKPLSLTPDTEMSNSLNTMTANAAVIDIEKEIEPGTNLSAT